MKSILKALKLLWSRVRCWWHCLFNFHRSVEETEGVRFFGILRIYLKSNIIYCHDCEKVFHCIDDDHENRISIAKKKFDSFERVEENETSSS